MPSDSKFTRDDDGNVAVRVVSNTGVSEQPESMFTKDEDGNTAVRVVFGEGGGGSDQHNLGWYATQAALEEAYPTANAGDWAIVGSTDTVWLWDTDNEEWVDSDQKGQVTSVNGQTGDVVLDLLPSQTGQSGKFLTTDGTDASWGTTIQDRLNISLNSSNAEFMRFTNQNNVVMQLQQFGTGSAPQFAFYWKSSSSSQQRAVVFQGTSVFPNINDETLGKDTNKWANVYTTKINNGADITVPTVAGSMSVQVSSMPTADSTLEGQIYQFTGATDSTYTNGRFYKCVSDGQNPATYSWTEVSMGGSSLPSQTGNAGKFLTTDGTDASWSDKPLVNASSNNTGISIRGATGSSESVFIGDYSGGLACNYSVYIGRASAPAGGAGHHNVAVGYNAKTATNAYGCVQLGSGTCGNGEFCVALSSSFGANPVNYTVMKSDGTIPTARLTKVNSTITLAAADWSSNTQTVNVTGMTADGVVMVSPDPTDQSAYTSAGILCTSQAAGTLTFSCDTAPSGDIDVNVVML